MQVNRTKNAARNIVFGVLLKLYHIVVPFFMRTVMIHFMGVQYLGVNSFFTSVLQVLNLAELGVGAAMVYSMYEPVAKGDTPTICALLNLYRTFYRAIGIFIGAVGLLLTPFIPRLVKSGFPSDLNIYLVYWLNLAATCLSYWLFAYKNALLVANQRSDVASKVTILTKSLQFVLQFLALYLVRNYYLYMVISLVTQALTNVFTAAVATKMYPQFIPRGHLPKGQTRQITGRIRDLFTAKVSTVVLKSFDSIVISSALGLTTLAVYQNYYFIVSSVINTVETIFESCMSGIGNSIIFESESKNYRDLVKFSFAINWISGICACCFLNLFQPFIELWVGKELMLPFQVVVCFCLYFYSYEMNRMINTFKDAAGLWHEDRFRPMTAAIVNLGLNLFTVRFLGVYGVILSTVVSFVLVEYPWLLHNLFSTLFDRSLLWNYVLCLLNYVTVTALICTVSYFACNGITGNLYLTLFFRAVVCLVLPNILFIAVYFRKPEFIECVELADRMTNHRLHLSQHLNKVLKKI